MVVWPRCCGGGCAGGARGVGVVGGVGNNVGCIWRCGGEWISGYRFLNILFIG